MCNSVRQPSKNIQNNMFMRRENIAKISTVEYVLKSWEHADPDRRPIITGNESTEKKCQNACVNFMTLDFFGGLCSSSRVRVILQNERQASTVAKLKKGTTHLQE